MKLTGCATSRKGGTGEMRGSIVSGMSQRMTIGVRSSKKLELLISNPRVSLVPPVLLDYPARYSPLVLDVPVIEVLL